MLNPPADRGAGRAGSGRSAADTVEWLLDRPLSRLGGVVELEAAATRVVQQPLDMLLADLRAVLSAWPISVEAQRRLHLLISHMYHHRSVTGDLAAELRAGVIHGFNRTRSQRLG